MLKVHLSVQVVRVHLAQVIVLALLTAVQATDRLIVLVHRLVVQVVAIVVVRVLILRHLHVKVVNQVTNVHRQLHHRIRLHLVAVVRPAVTRQVVLAHHQVVVQVVRLRIAHLQVLQQPQLLCAQHQVRLARVLQVVIHRHNQVVVQRQ